MAEDEFAYWGNEGNDQTQLILMLSEQVAELEVEVEEQGAIIDELSESVAYKAGATRPIGVGTKGVSVRGAARMARLPMMKPAAMAKMGVRMGARMALKELGVSVPYVGLIISLAFTAYEGAMKEIAHQAAIDAIKQHEKESKLETEQKFGDAIRKVEEARREQYRSLVS